jgi:hypothetical protein
MEVLTRSERIETLFKGFSPPPTFNHARSRGLPALCFLSRRWLSLPRPASHHRRSAQII